MANGELIKQVREQLQDPKGMTAKQAQIMTLTLLMDLYDKWEEDNKKVEEMWPAFNIGKWIVLAFGAANVTLIVGLITHAFKFP